MQVSPTILLRKILRGVTYHLGLDIMLWGTYSSLVTIPNLGLFCSLLNSSFL